MTSYYVIVVFDLPRESESRFAMYSNPDSLIECPLIRLYLVEGGGDNGYGSGVVTSLRTFDREQRKQFHIPVINSV